MDRWSIEELHHANLLNRFLEEAGYPERQGLAHGSDEQYPEGIFS